MSAIRCALWAATSVRGAIAPQAARPAIPMNSRLFCTIPLIASGRQYITLACGSRRLVYGNCGVMAAGRYSGRPSAYTKVLMNFEKRQCQIGGGKSNHPYCNGYDEQPHIPPAGRLAFRRQHRIGRTTASWTEQRPTRGRQQDAAACEQPYFVMSQRHKERQIGKEPRRDGAKAERDQNNWQRTANERRRGDEQHKPPPLRLPGRGRERWRVRVSPMPAIIRQWCSRRAWSCFGT